jgi:hypothetical protein
VLLGQCCSAAAAAAGLRLVEALTALLGSRTPAWRQAGADKHSKQGTWACHKHLSTAAALGALPFNHSWATLQWVYRSGNMTHAAAT